MVEREEAETGTTRKLVGRGAEAEKARSALIDINVVELSVTEIRY